jgi:hypothetical protein
MTHVLFVASNDLHAGLFAPVAAECRARGWRATAIPLDPWYGQGAGPALDAHGLTVDAVPGREPRPRADFYARPAPIVIRDAMRARRPLVEHLLRLRPDVLVVGNDRGLIEKVALDAARGLGARTVLVQDGALAARPAPEPTVRRRMWRTARRAGSAVVRRLGLTAYAATEYGLGGCDLVAVTGPAGEAAMLARGVPPDRIAVVGQPRYDGLRPTPLEDRAGIVWFTTPFAAQNLGSDRQARQVGSVLDAARAATAAGVPFAIRPPPRVDPSAYADATGAGARLLIEGSAADALAIAEVAVMGISTVSEEAGIVAVPVLVPSGPLADRGLEELLPQPPAYPRFATSAELIERTLDWRTDPGARAAVVALQSAAVHGRVRFDPDESAAWRIVERISGLVAEATT